MTKKLLGNFIFFVYLDETSDVSLLGESFMAQLDKIRAEAKGGGKG